MKEQKQYPEIVVTENYFERERPFFRMKRQCEKTCQNVKQFMIDAKVWETMETVARFLMSHPILLAACIATVLAVAIPLLLFILFAIVNVAFVFTSFIIIEATVLTIGAMVLCSVLFCQIVTIIVMGSCLVLMYSVAHYILSVLRSIKSEQF